MNQAARRGARIPTVATALLLLAATDLSLRVLGFARSLAMARKLTRVAAKSSHVQVAEICHRIALAAVWYPGRARCLEQSLALFVLLRRRGIAAELRIGVRPYPFVAHSWVELDGVAVNEQPEIVRQFVPMRNFAV